MQHIYALLVAGPTDVPGALAYFVYKRCKIEWRSKFEADHARQPTLDEEAAYVSAMALPEQIDSFKRRGGELASEFATNLLKAKMAQLATQVTQSEIATKFSALETQVASSLARIESRFDEKKTFKAWMQDIGTAFVSNIGLIVVVGVLAIGYQGMALISGRTERALNDVRSLNRAPRAAAPAANSSTPPVVPATGS